MRARRRILARVTSLALAVLLVLGGPATTATAAPGTATDEPTGTGPEAEEAIEDATRPTSVPKNVLSWYAGPGLETAAAQSETLTGEGDLTLGPPHPVHSWAPDFLAGTQTSTPVLADGQWVAALLRDSPDGPAAVGALRAGPFDGTEPQGTDVVADADVGGLVAPEELSFAVVYDPSLDGWFATAEGDVWSVGAGGREVLHGAVPLSVLGDFLTERDSSPSPTAAGEEPGQEGSGLVPLTVIAVIVLLGILGAGLLVRNYRAADSRLEADIRAGLTPLDGIPRLDRAGREPAAHHPGGGTGPAEPAAPADRDGPGDSVTPPRR